MGNSLPCKYFWRWSILFIKDTPKPDISTYYGVRGLHDKFRNTICMKKLSNVNIFDDLVFLSKKEMTHLNQIVIHIMVKAVRMTSFEM